MYSKKLTRVGFQVLWGHHNDEADRPFIAEHLIGPPADGAHAFDCCNAIVGDKHLKKQNSQIENANFCSQKLKYFINDVCHTYY